MPHTTLINASNLARRLATNTPNWIVIDCRFKLSDTEAGRRAHAQAHIPGAIYAHLDEHLSGPVTESSGRHPLPTPEALATTFGSWGITTASQVIVYDDNGGGIAARLWWLLRYMGHNAVALLNGGWQAWEQGGYPTSNAPPRPTRTRFGGTPRPELMVTTEDVQQLRHNADWVLVDSRSPERYSGQEEPIDPVAGHIPGADNHYWQHNLDSEGSLLSAIELYDWMLLVLGDVPPEQCIFYCGSGVTACLNILAMEVAGLHGSKLYPGSWSEWIRNPNRPRAANT